MMMFEPIVTVMLSGFLYNVEVLGAKNCEQARQYAEVALTKPERSQTRQAWDNVNALICSYDTNRIDIRMTYLDGWYWNKRLVDNPFYQGE